MTIYHGSGVVYCDAWSHAREPGGIARESAARTSRSVSLAPSRASSNPWSTSRSVLVGDPITTPGRVTG